MNLIHPSRFWREAIAIRGSVLPMVLPYVVIFGVIATILREISRYLESEHQIKISLEVTLYEIIGAALGFILVLRTNAGYDRWYEGRKLWGGIVNQCRNLGMNCLAYAGKDPNWQRDFMKLVTLFPFTVRNLLRGQLIPEEAEKILGQEDLLSLKQFPHPPSFVLMKLAKLLMKAKENGVIDDFAFLNLDQERARLMDHLGACERILKTPLPLIYSIEIRRSIALFLFILPLALLHRLENDWQTAFLTMMVAYVLFTLEIIGIQLQNPFAAEHLSALPLDDICKNIERQLTGAMPSENKT